jgi:hypothetical protein
LETDEPLVTAVIPTRNRSELVVRAVESALAQTYLNLEVVVVIDGHDPVTEAGLGRIRDRRLKVVTLTEHAGASEARNVGVRAARGDWIALLDDDDQWMLEKLACQVTHALRSKYRFPILSSRFVCRTPAADYIWPRRLPAPGEPLCEYLLARGSLFQGEGMMATSTLFMRRELLVKVPFRKLRKHQDWDWVLRATSQPGAGVEFCSPGSTSHSLARQPGEPLAIWRMDEPRDCISRTKDWRFSLSWAQSMRPFMTARAYAGFLLTVVAAQAARASSRGEYLSILREAVRHGAPSMLDLALFLGMRAIPRETRQRLRAMFGRSAG